MNAKIFFEGQIRRTTLEASPTFEELRNKLSKLFNEPSIKDSKLTTIKYADEDGDWIDMSSDEELSDALKWTRAYQQVIRIQITFKSVPEVASKPVSSPSDSPIEEKTENGTPSASPKDIFDELKPFVKHFEGMAEQFKPFTTQIVQELNKEQPVESLLSLFEKFFTNSQGSCKNDEEKYEDVVGETSSETSQNTRETTPKEEKEEEKPVHFAICDNCRTRIKGIRHKCRECRDYDLCETCIFNKDSVHPLHSFLSIDKPASPAGPSVCPWMNSNRKGEASSSSAAAIHWATCDQCQQRIVGLRFKCESCDDYDLCGECFQNQEEVHPEHEFTCIEKPLLPFRCARRVNATSAEKSEASVPVPAQAPYDNSCVLDQQKADLGESVPEFVIVDPVVQEPEPQSIVAPVATVQDESSDSSDEESSDEEEEEESAVNFVSDSQIKPGMTRETLQEGLKQLSDMGFTDREKNIALIIRNEGDIVATILELLQ